MRSLGKARDMLKLVQEDYEKIDQPKQLQLSGSLTRIPKPRSVGKQQPLPQARPPKRPKQPLMLQAALKRVSQAPLLLKLKELKKCEVGKNIYSYSPKRLEPQYWEEQGECEIEYRPSRQGKVGDCYFVSAYNSIVDRDYGEKLHPLSKLIQRTHRTTMPVDVLIFQSGLPLIQTLMPTLPPDCAAGLDGDATCALLQKASARFYMGYDNLQLGHNSDSFRDLTGAPTQYISLQDPNVFGPKISDALIKGFFLAASSKPAGCVDGIVARHSYSLLGARKKGGRQFFKLQNPSGQNYQHENGLTSAMVGEQVVQPLGKFWIDGSCLMRNFEVIGCCRYHSGYISNSLAVQRKEANAPFIKVVRSKNVTHAYISLYQRHYRSYQNAGSHSYGVVALALHELGEDLQLGRTLGQAFSNKQTAYFEADLKPGLYLLSCELREASLEDTHALTVNLYSDQDLELLDAESQSPGRLFNKVVSRVLSDNRGQRFSLHEYRTGARRTYGATMGRVCILYQNQSGKRLVEEIRPTRCQNVAVDKQRVEVEAGEQLLLEYPIGNRDGLSHRLTFQSSSKFQ